MFRISLAWKCLAVNKPALSSILRSCTSTSTGELPSIAIADSQLESMRSWCQHTYHSNTFAGLRDRAAHLPARHRTGSPLSFRNGPLQVVFRLLGNPEATKYSGIARRGFAPAHHTCTRGVD